ncbi:MAG: type II secretion system F family protein [Pseudomonadota bacterium]
MDYLYYIFGLLIFISVVLLLEGAYLAWNSSRGPAAERLARRMRTMTAPDEASASMIKRRLLSTSPALQRTLLQLPRVAQLDTLLQQSGLPWNVARLLGYMLLDGALALAGASYAGLAWPLRLAAALAGALLPLLYVRHAKARRLQRIELQLPDALDLMGRAMRAGHAFPTALKLVGEEMNAPLADEFRAVFDEVNFGIAMPDALMNLASRVPSTDLRYFVIAVLIQRETGGNLSELLGSISAIIRDRIKLMGQVRVLSAEGRLSAWILSTLPFGAALMIQLTNPKFLAMLYTDPAGQKLVAGSLVMMVLGILAMRSIIRIRV